MTSAILSFTLILLCNLSDQPDLRYWEGYLINGQRILTGPLRWRQADWFRALALTTATVGLYNYDQGIDRYIQDHRTNTTDRIADWVRPFGDPLYVMPPVGGWLLFGYLFNNKKARTTALSALESFILTSAITYTIKHATHRHRPNSNDSYDVWDGPGFESEHLSFPSGHASTSFAIMTVIASQYDEHIIVPTLCYSIATLTTLSRINDQAHWASDVFIGSLVGFITARTILNHDQEEKEK
ncbi:MAG TPA: phosphatase PAP2 family protein, partial [bacterium (Candidatus Stahlbacteria)]|nr:phosphatase PAP2 family protein [Candidatus Stahlbacteria bacterium]